MWFICFACKISYELASHLEILFQMLIDILKSRQDLRVRKAWTRYRLLKASPNIYIRMLASQLGVITSRVRVIPLKRGINKTKTHSQMNPKAENRIHL